MPQEFLVSSSSHKQKRRGPRRAAQRSAAGDLKGLQTTNGSLCPCPLVTAGVFTGAIVSLHIVIRLKAAPDPVTGPIKELEGGFRPLLEGSWLVVGLPCLYSLYALQAGTHRLSFCALHCYCF